METMHRLHIADPAEFWRLPPAWQARHISHVYNDITGAYMSDLKPIPDYDEKGRPKKPTIDAADLMRSQLEFKTAPPSQTVIDNARMLLNVPGLHPLLIRDAQETLRRAGLDA